MVEANKKEESDGGKDASLKEEHEGDEAVTDIPTSSGKSDILIQQAQNICITFVQCWTNVEDIGPMLYKCYANVLCLLGIASRYSTILFIYFIILKRPRGIEQMQCATLMLDSSTQSSNPGTGQVHILRHWTCWSNIYIQGLICLCNVTRPILVLSACLTSSWIVCSRGNKTMRRRQ